ncbi:hypothetical protein [Stieleria mannarensis]|uniref:hypothetical protein n=1 Tax=Stieleria mannarensis TaxID=2755585 RepID=UPI00160192D6|nr:hypothetical protein [Rhodopirellula sp. JC639]
MKFRLSTILLVVLSTAAMCGWWVDRRRLQDDATRANSEAARLAIELYRVHLKQCYQQDYGSIFPAGARAIQLKTGDVLDVTVADGRQDLLDRLGEGETNFRVRDQTGKVLEIGDLLPVFPMCSGKRRTAQVVNGP